MMEKKHIQHLFWRAGFGLGPMELQLLEGRSKQQIIDTLFSDSAPIYPLYIDLSEFKGLNPGMMKSNPRQLRDFIKRSNELIREFNYAWFQRMSNPKAVLRERMTLFWSNHFVCRDNNIKFVQQYNNTLRRHALGHLGDFTKAVSKEPAMLKYLNNKQNIKKSPNENFARELMELFTLGTGHYTERDIRESARAFTGYFHDFDGRFVFRFRQHDTGVKRFLGYRGRFTGDDIVNIILAKRQCARFICEKIYTYFVNEKIVDEQLEEMVEVFYNSYDIEKLMYHVFSSDWFYDERNIGNKIKSPVEFLVGINRTVPVKFNKVNQSFFVQRFMGQALLDPPNVAGWKGGRSWINTNTLLFRLKLPSVLLSGGIIPLKRDGQFYDPLFERLSSRVQSKMLDVSPDWKAFDKHFAIVNTEELPEMLLQPPVSARTAAMLKNHKSPGKQSYAVQLMSLPEYQLC